VLTSVVDEGVFKYFYVYIYNMNTIYSIVITMGYYSRTIVMYYCNVLL
jgi:hypothetical protein